MTVLPDAGDDAQPEAAVVASVLDSIVDHAALPPSGWGPRSTEYPIRLARIPDGVRALSNNRTIGNGPSE